MCMPVCVCYGGQSGLLQDCCAVESCHGPRYLPGVKQALATMLKQADTGTEEDNVAALGRPFDQG